MSFFGLGKKKIRKYVAPIVVDCIIKLANNVGDETKVASRGWKAFLKYSEPLLKAFGVGAVAITIINILKDALEGLKNDQLEVRKEIEEIINGLEGNPDQIPEEVTKKLEELDKKHPFLKVNDQFEKAMQKKAQETLDDFKYLTNEITESDYVYFTFAEGKSDDEALRIKQEATTVLYGTSEPGGLFSKLQGNAASDDITIRSLGIIQNFIDDRCEGIADENFINLYADENKLLDEERSDDIGNLRCFVTDTGMYFNFRETIDVTDNLRKEIEKVIDSLNVCVAPNEPSNESETRGKFFSGYFLV